MRDVEYVNRISPTDRYRHWRRSEKGRVLKFTVQFETLLEGQWRPVVRYDTAHGYVHKDLIHPHQRQGKIFIVAQSFNEGLTLAEEDIRRNWMKYKAAFLKEWQGHEKEDE